MSGLTIGAELFAFLIVLAVLWRYVVPMLSKGIDERQQAIRAQIEGSREARARMEKAEADFRSSRESAEVEAAQFRDDARAQSQQIVEELRERARAESARILHRGGEQLAAERDTLVREVRSDVGRLAVDLAEWIVTASLRDEGRRRATVKRALGQMRPGDDSPRADEPRRTPVTTVEGRT